jgi:SAM-dependent methyltransferase
MSAETKVESPPAPAGVFASERINSKDLGLAAGLLIGRVLFETDELHFGYWDQGLEVKIGNMAAAQERYSQFLLSHIPEGTKSILDVGCGAGKLAERLIGQGYRVECVCPSPLLVGEATRRLGADVPVHLCTFDAFETERRFDLVLFSESFQYVDIEDAIDRARRFLRPGGHLLICDFFRRDVEGTRYIRGGHRWKSFQRVIEASPFECLEDEDITEWTSPTQDVANDVTMGLIGPLWQIVRSALRERHSLISKLVEWKFKRKIAKVEQKYFSGLRDSAHFREFLTYRLLVYRNKDA